MERGGDDTSRMRLGRLVPPCLLLGAVVLSLAVSLSSRRGISDHTVVTPRPRDAAFGIAWGTIYAALFAAAFAGIARAQATDAGTADAACACSLVLATAWVPLYVHGSVAAQGAAAVVLAISAAVATISALCEAPSARWTAARWLTWAASGLLAGWLLVASTLNVGNVWSAWHEPLYAIPATVGALLAVNGAHPLLALPLAFAFALTPMDVVVAVCLGVACLGVICASIRLAVRLRR